MKSAFSLLPVYCLLLTGTAQNLKRGVAFNQIADVEPFLQSSNVGWAYNWSSADCNVPHNNFQFIPMIWGQDDGDVAKYHCLVNSGYNTILGFNEPDQPSQSNMSPSDASSYYKTKFLSKDAKIISPAVSSSSKSNEGLDWIRQFMSADNCSSCNVGGLAVHWYGESASDLKAFIENATEVAKQYSLAEIWLTEFGLSSDTAAIVDIDAAESFIMEVVPWLESHPMITRYAYFMCKEGFLISNGKPNAAGQAYMSIKSSAASW